MEHILSNMLHTALWFFFVIFIFAVIGVVAVISWIMNAVRKTETAVQTGVANVEGHLHHHNE